jgi:hypothetical protein
VSEKSGRKRSRYEQVWDGQWFTLPDEWDLACCDCGLVHKVKSRIKDGVIQIRMDRHPTATGGRRKAMRSEK